MTGTILIVDDEQSMRSSLRRLLEFNDFTVAEASNASEALDELEHELPSVILLDVRMPEVDGLELLPRLLAVAPHIPVIILTGHGDIPMAVKATKLGAYDFLPKPADNELLLRTVQRACEMAQLTFEKLKLQNEVVKLNAAVDMSLEWMLGNSEAMRSVIEQIQQVAWSNFSVILQGETGSGKSLIATIIHNLGKGIEKPFVRVDVGALPESLIESELFGHEKGAFTGAGHKKKGYFEMAHGGTLFIDELENISTHMQSKLLGVIEQRKVYPVGSTAPVEIDVRIIAATNKDIKQCVQQQEFREDLFFRLGEFFIQIPPLRERMDDMMFFAKRFFNEAAEEIKRPMHGISDEVFEVLARYSWPGNVRELKNVIRRAALLANDGVIRPDNISFLGGAASAAPTQIMPLKELSALVVREAESKAIRQALKATLGNKTKAAALLKIDYTTLLAKIKEYRIS
ncbi:MAG TPA: sigma-54 dependent transcriptional regulator [Dissulfurispiraceae bacterium]|nr:sigma-54 dependent transcriptional regulator [Dissulfurispiraceae bacterium]